MGKPSRNATKSSLSTRVADRYFRAFKSPLLIAPERIASVLLTDLDNSPRGKRGRLTIPRETRSICSAQCKPDPSIARLSRVRIRSMLSNVNSYNRKGPVVAHRRSSKALKGGSQAENASSILVTRSTRT